MIHRIVFLALLVLPFTSQAHDPTQHAKANVPAIAAEAKPAVAAVDAFSSALQAGDLKRAGTWLADDVLILESGGAEHSKAEYMGGHATHDAEFLKGAHVQLKQRTAKVAGELAWVGSESELHTSKDGKPVTTLSTETMVLKRGKDGWRIVHIHWSSRAKR